MDSFILQESDDLKNATDYIESLESATKNFKQSLRSHIAARKEEDDEDEEDDTMIDEIIQSVFTENQSRTLKEQTDTLSKKAKLARGDVRGIFMNLSKPTRSSFPSAMLSSNHKSEDVVDWTKNMAKCTIYKPPPVDYDDDEAFNEPKLRINRLDHQANRFVAVHQLEQPKHKRLPRTPSYLYNGTLTNRSSSAVSNGHAYDNGAIGAHDNQANISQRANSDRTNSYRMSGQRTGITELYGSMRDVRVDAACTRIEHLGRNDINLLQVFAETEIRTVFVENGDIKFNKLSTKRRSKDAGTFGVSLEALLSRDIKKLPSTRVPLFVTLMIGRLETHVGEEGIFRVPGNQARIKESVHFLETCDNALPHLQSLMPHDLAGLFKHFFRTLPQPLLTLKWLDAFCKALSIQDSSIKLHAFQTLICLLPAIHRATLQLLTELLLKMSKCPSSRMTLETVCMVISPSLFPSLSTPASSLTSEVEHLGQFNGVILFILRNSAVIWNVPSLFLKQMREVGMKTCLRSKKFKKRTPENSTEKIYIHSLHPNHSQESLCITSATTVAMVLETFNSFKQPRFAESACLFENGGIIDQRLLLAREHMGAIVEENPHVRFSLCIQNPLSLVSHWPPPLYQ